jgi:uncharacterized protein
MEIRDPIHGNIQLNETEAKIVDTPEMQRLRYIKQLDTTYLIFPGANNSRFEHSLGTMHVTKELTAQIYGKGFEELSYVGLLHDIGHGPFSHLSEDVIKKHLHKNHEQLGDEAIRKSAIKDIISDSGLSFNKIMSYFNDAEKIDIVGGPLGSDRIDYLMRDSHYTGVAYGIIDYERLKSRLTLYKGRVSIMDSGISGAESLLIARYFMFQNVYSHHAKTISNKMLLKALELAVENGVFDAKELARMYDEELVYRLVNSDNKRVSRLAGRFRNRNLFKRAYFNNLKENIEIEKLEKEIMRAGIASDGFVAHVIQFGGGKDNMDVVDSENNYIGKLTEVSPFMKTLSDVLTTSKTLLVACDKKDIKKVNEVVRKFVE